MGKTFSTLVGLLVLMAGSGSQAATVTPFGPSQWGASDATLGISGFTIEDFEDTTLAPGLQVKVQSPSQGGYGPTSTLPFTFSGANDLVGGPGGVFGTGVVWDGVRTLVNRPTQTITSYANDGGWSDVSFLFSGGVSSFGFSYGQAEANIVMTVDFGSGNKTTFNSTSFLGTSGGRNGYLRFDAGPGETIYGITLDNQSGNHDGIVYDHVAFKPVSSGVPDAGSTAALMALGLAILGGVRKRL